MLEESTKTTILEYDFQRSLIDKKQGIKLQNPENVENGHHLITQTPIPNALNEKSVEVVLEIPHQKGQCPPKSRSKLSSVFFWKVKFVLFATKGLLSQY